MQTPPRLWNPGQTPTLLLATTNNHKVQELRGIFAQLALPITLESLSDLKGKFPEPVESGSTFEANATIKANSYAAMTGLICLADDSGIEVDALAGKPGVISSHYCTDGKETGMSREERDQANNQRVLRELESVPAERRSARFVCVMALAVPPDHPAFHNLTQSTKAPLMLTRGTFEGRIGLPPRVPSGSKGFGYDPLFLMAPDFVRTASELTETEKNACSHRGMAARIMAQQLHASLS